MPPLQATRAYTLTLLTVPWMLKILNRYHLCSTLRLLPLVLCPANLTNFLSSLGARSKQRGISSIAAARHLQSDRVHTDVFQFFFSNQEFFSFSKPDVIFV